MSATDRMVTANEQYAPSHSGGASPRPAQQAAIVTCMDCRIDPAAVFGLQVGDAHVMRNAGGLVTDDVLRSLAISQRALGTREVLLVHHTECGMNGFDDDDFRAQLRSETGATPPWQVPGFADVRADTAESVRRVRECAWLPHRDAVRGFVFDVSTGRLDEVEVG